MENEHGCFNLWICRIIDLSGDQDTTDLEKCIHCAIKALETKGGLETATLVAVGNLKITLL